MPIGKPTYGVEIEFGGTDRYSVMSALQEDFGLRVPEAGYSNHVNATWTMKSDTTVSGGELVSPILRWEKDRHLEQLAYYVKALKSVGAATDRDAGIHVHIGAADFTPKHVINIVRNFVRFEDVIYRLGTSGWDTLRPNGRSMAKPIPASVVKALGDCRTKADIYQAWVGRDPLTTSPNAGYGDRYRAVNLLPWFDSNRGTIEFRIFNSTLNHKRVIAYVALVQALVEDARTHSRYLAAAKVAGEYRENPEQADKQWRIFKRVLLAAGLSKEHSAYLEDAWRQSNSTYGLRRDAGDKAVMASKPELPAVAPSAPVMHCPSCNSSRWNGRSCGNCGHERYPASLARVFCTACEVSEITAADTYCHNPDCSEYESERCLQCGYYFGDGCDNCAGGEE